MPTYEEYTAMGGTLGELDYLPAARQAYAYLDTITLGKASNATGSAAVKVASAVVALADEIHRQETSREVASATNDGYSETYVTSGKTGEDKKRAIAVQYLATTGLLYRGGACCACMH